MKKYNIKDWLEGRVGARCETREAYLRLMDIAEENGIKWECGMNPHDLDEAYWDYSEAIRVEDEKKLMSFDHRGKRRTLEELERPKDDVDLSDVSTKELVEELARRDGVGTVNEGGYMMLLGIKREVLK